MDMDWEALRDQARQFVIGMFVNPPDVEIIGMAYGPEHEYVGHTALSLGSVKIAPLLTKRMAPKGLCKRLHWLVLISDSDLEEMGPFPSFVEACIVATMLWTAEELIEQFVE